MENFRDFAILLLIYSLILQGRFGACYKNEVHITPAPPEELTTEKSSFFGGIKNFFRGSPTTTTTTTAIPNTFRQNAQKPPPLSISEAPLVPLGPRPDTPSSSAFGEQPQWPAIGPSVVTTSTTVRPKSPSGQTAEHFVNNNNQRQGSIPGNVASQAIPFANVEQVQRPGNSQNFPLGLMPSRPDRPQPSGFDLSYGGNNSGDKNMFIGNQPRVHLASMTSSTTTTSTTTTIKPSPAQHSTAPLQPKQPQMDIDLRFDSSTTTARSLMGIKEDFPALPAPRRKSTDSHEDFPALPAPKSSSQIPQTQTRQSPSWNTTPTPPRTAHMTPGLPAPNSPPRAGSPSPPYQNTGTRASFLPPSGLGAQRNDNKPKPVESELQQLTEELYTKEVNSQLALIRVDIQGRTRSIDSGDEAQNALLTVDNRALQTATIEKLRPLFNNYEIDTLTNEHVTPNERREENEFLDAVMATSVMRHAMLYLQNKGIVTADPKTHRDLVKELWFTQYSRGSGRVGSSGFEHVFVNEVKNGTLIGLHNWVYFYEEENAGRLDYKGYLKELDIGTKAKVLKLRFTHNGINKPVNTLFVGTSPELELALYTVCFMLRPDVDCPVSLANKKFYIRTYSWRYRGKNLIGSAYPEI